MIDLQKAFDTVNHAIMSDKLGAIGCDDGSVKWFNSYLSNIHRHKGDFIRPRGSYLWRAPGLYIGTFIVFNLCERYCQGRKGSSANTNSTPKES